MIPCEAINDGKTNCHDRVRPLMLVVPDIGPTIVNETSRKGRNDSPSLGKSVRSAVKSLK